MLIEQESQLFNIVHSGIDNEDICWNPLQKSLLLHFISTIFTQKNIIIYAFSILDHQYQLLVHGKREAVVDSINYLRSKFNRCSDVDCGFSKRYTLILIKNHKYYLAVCRYIHLSSVTFGLVTRPDLYIWSSYLDYINEKNMYTWVHRNYHTSDRYSTKTYTLQGNDLELIYFYESIELEGVLE